MSKTSPKIAIIIGAGPAGLTAAYELLMHTSIKPIVVEMSSDMGGISKTVNYKGNRIDIGGHRFFSKSQRVMDWWQNILPIQNDTENAVVSLNYQGKKSEISLPKSSKLSDKVLLIRNRVSRVFFLQKFFKYPISFSFQTFSKLGFITTLKIGFSYVFIRLFPIAEESSLEDFFINRFGKTLYLTFFKDYTEKVWGKSCKEIPAEWGAQRIKGVSVGKAISHAFTQIFTKNKDVNQKNTETSLIEKFLYPKFGPGQMWEEVARIVKEKGGEILINSKVTTLFLEQNKVKEITITNTVTDKTTTLSGDYFFSTMPVKELIKGIQPKPPSNVVAVANNLLYRDFITVGLLLKNLKIKSKKANKLISDNWIYIQEKSVKLGRLQVFNNWSPHLVKNPDNVWLGLEYFCNEGDDLWQKKDTDFIQFAIDELASINIIEKEAVIDATLIRMPKTYPAYFGSYKSFNEIRNYTDSIENLFLIGRNGMHKYNNQDHSMLTAMTAVENIKNKILSKDNIWAINTEQDYHEEA
ncbi:MAG: NAD(P)/FAD-dependent oxidoreductase [Flavobacteriaceae bacterium]